MRRKGIEATKVLVNEDPESMELIKGLGYTEAPVVIVREAGEIVDHWGGYHEERIIALKEKVPA
jgi:glutaredoxin-like protein NrdH